MCLKPRASPWKNWKRFGIEELMFWKKAMPSGMAFFVSNLGINKAFFWGRTNCMVKDVVDIEVVRLIMHIFIN